MTLLRQITSLFASFFESKQYQKLWILDIRFLVKTEEPVLYINQIHQYETLLCSHERFVLVDFFNQYD